ncbi:hypothetical protein IVA96_23845 [Bradyrhizobium sp. 159]|uniref:hypothetical protein n=1 Tax=Bradyrhizobium sp. 159 TaxID=2782632 RepID=UPI001FFAD509|nr:hypothetical protein [Bradyrhizobium sp. 159]MCK1619552.1 hypothetical protein [Bradyrhizobium sp. 159]
MTEVDNRALRRALQIERITRKQFARRLRSMLKRTEYDEFLRICRAEAIEMTAHLANVTVEVGDAQQRRSGDRPGGDACRSVVSNTMRQPPDIGKARARRSNGATEQIDSSPPKKPIPGSLH